MEVREKVLTNYEDELGRCPFDEWLEALSSREARAIIRVRLIRVRMGNFGNCEPVGDGVLELKIFFGPGYRVYFAPVGDELVVLLCGGDKGSQSKDIRRAREIWADYRSRNNV